MLTAISKTKRVRTQPRPVRLPGAGSASVRRRAGFTITELLIVVGVIVLLLGILLPALAAVRSAGLKTRTTATMNGFANAASVFHQDHGRYPGAIPENVLAECWIFSGTQNAILDMLGGVRTLRPNPNPAEIAEFNEFDGQEIQLCGSGWQIKIDLASIGEGPYIDGRIHNPYLTMGESELRYVPGQEGPSGGMMLDQINLPTLVDAYGQPIIYMRALRSSGPLVGTVDQRPQYVADLPAGQGTLLPYSRSLNLGRLGENQTADNPNVGASLFNTASNPNAFLAQILRNPGFGIENDPINQGVARGAFTLISAGRDGVFFSRTDGPGSIKNPSNGSELIENPDLLREYDDIVVAGGG